MTDEFDFDDTCITEQDLLENPTARVPVLLCLDTSGSMSGQPIRELAEGVELFYREVTEDELACHSVEIAIVTFGGTVQTHADFGPVQQRPDLSFTASGATPMGRAVLEGLRRLEERKSDYKSHGVDYYQPWLVLMTDGAPTDDITEAASRCSALVEARQLTVFPIGIGPQANLETLARFSPRRTPLRLQGLEFRKFFEWLSKSVQRVSASIPGQSVPLPAPTGWSSV